MARVLNYILSKFYKVFICALLFNISFAHAQSCYGLFADDKPSSRAELYPTILSNDFDFLKTEARFDEGPSPQKNMAMVTKEDQFRIVKDDELILRAKERLVKRNLNSVIQVASGKETKVLSAVREQFEYALEELPKLYPDFYDRSDNALKSKLTGESISREDLLSTNDVVWAVEELGKMVPDDLIFLEKNANGDFVIIGGHLAFPTHWSVGVFLGASITEIHASVSKTPEESQKFAAVINRVCARTLEADTTVRRNNWFIEQDPRYPLPDYLRTEYAAPLRLDERNYQDNIFLRVERQTIRGLKNSQVVVFAIHPVVYSFRSLLKDSDIAEKIRAGIKVKLLPDKNLPHYQITLYKLISKLLGDEERREPAN